jgi:hypothetical protein
MAEDFSAQSFTNSGLVYYNNIAVGTTSDTASYIYYNFSNPNPGIFIEWEHSGNTNTAFYRIQKSSNFDGTYMTLATVPYPMNEGVDSNGTPSDYYRIQEIDSNGNTLNTSSPMLGDELLIKSSLRYELEHLLNIPVYDEEIIFRKDRTMGTVAFPHWNYVPRPDIRISGPSNQGDRDPLIQLSETNPIYTTINSSYDPILYSRDGNIVQYTDGNNYPNGLRVKYDFKGNVYFIDINGNPVSIQSYDSVMASYNIKMFTSEHMNSSLNMALQAINAQPGASKYLRVADAPYYYDPALIYGACYYLIRALLLSLTSRQRRLLIEDPDAKFTDDLRQTATMYKEDFEKMLEKLPISRYPGIKSVVVPEFNMPGGRSRFFRYIWNIGTGG